jgi:hypothetical protein
MNKVNEGMASSQPRTQRVASDYRVDGIFGFRINLPFLTH